MLPYAPIIVGILAIIVTLVVASRSLKQQREHWVLDRQERAYSAVAEVVILQTDSTNELIHGNADDEQKASDSRLRTQLMSADSQMNMFGGDDVRTHYDTWQECIRDVRKRIHEAIADPAKGAEYLIAHLTSDGQKLDKYRVALINAMREDLGVPGRLTTRKDGASTDAE